VAEGDLKISMFQKWKIKVDAENIHKDQWNQIGRPRDCALPLRILVKAYGTHGRDTAASHSMTKK